ncbi:hypothetical protein Tco_1581718 [Tanacetum coccineum]
MAAPLATIHHPHHLHPIITTPTPSLPQQPLPPHGSRRASPPATSSPHNIHHHHLIIIIITPPPSPPKPPPQPPPPKGARGFITTSNGCVWFVSVAPKRVRLVRRSSQGEGVFVWGRGSSERGVAATTQGACGWRPPPKKGPGSAAMSGCSWVINSTKGALGCGSTATGGAFGYADCTKGAFGCGLTAMKGLFGLTAHMGRVWF